MKGEVEKENPKLKKEKGEMVLCISASKNKRKREKIDSVKWSDPRIYKALVTAVSDSVNSVFASFDCQHRENCVIKIDKSSLKTVSEISRQLGNSLKTIALEKLTYL
ncbi:hypothetical protein LguiB_007316 [Lonicera macranthoides]